MRILNFSQFVSLNESLTKPKAQVLLDGTSSAGKSVLLKKVPADFAILAVDEFYDLLAEEIGNQDFGNAQKISEIYPDCPYSAKKPGGKDWEEAARWYMAQESQHGKLKAVGMRSRNPEMGRGQSQTSVIYDDVQGTILKFAKPKPKWILIHAPIDHLKANVDRRPANDRRSLEGVLVGAYCFKYEALPKPGGVDPTRSWKAEEIKELFKGEGWIDQFISKLGIKDDAEYWIHTKKQPEGDYDVVINTRNAEGQQKSVDDMSSEFLAVI
jgi:hypothetical protein